MTPREKIVIKILLLVARIVSEKPEMTQEIQHLANHIATEFYR